MVKTAAPARCASQSRTSSKRLFDWNAGVVPPDFAGVEPPVTTRQLATYYQIMERTLANWRAEGRIPFWYINSRNIRYRISDCDRALSRNT